MVAMKLPQNITIIISILYYQAYIFVGSCISGVRRTIASCHLPFSSDLLFSPLLSCNILLHQQDLSLVFHPYFR